MVEMTLQPMRFGLKNGSKLTSLRLWSEGFTLATVTCSVLLVLPLVVDAGHEKTSFYHAASYYPKKLFRREPQHRNAGHGSRRTLSNFGPTAAVRNRRMFEHEDPPQARFDATLQDAADAVFPALNNDADGDLNLPMFSDEFDLDDAADKRNPWLNADDYAFVIALRLTDSEDYDDAVFSPGY